MKIDVVKLHYHELNNFNEPDNIQKYAKFFLRQLLLILRSSHLGLFSIHYFPKYDMQSYDGVTI